MAETAFSGIGGVGERCFERAPILGFQAVRNRLVWEDEVDGASLADNYTLALNPEVIGLERGAYQVSVADLQGKLFFRSSLEVK